MSSRFFWPITIFLIGVGMVLIWYTTVWGPGLMDWDSFNYVAGARSLAAGRGYLLPVNNATSIPLTHFPPGLSLILAIFERLRVDSLLASRYLNTVFFAGSVLFFILTVRQITQSRIFGILGGIVFVSSYLMISAYSWLLSEPLYILCILFALYFQGLYFEHKKFLYLTLSALGLCYAFFTRYVGIAGLITSILIILIKVPALKGKFLNSIFIGFLAGLPTFLFTVYNFQQTHTVDHRTLGWYPLSMNNLVNGYRAIYAWFLPDRVFTGHEKLNIQIVLVLLIAGVIVSVAYGWIRHRNILYFFIRIRELPVMLLLHLVYLLLFAVTIVLSKMFFDPNIGLGDDRIWSPGYASASLIAVSSLGFLSKARIKSFSLAVPAFILLAYILSFNIWMSFATAGSIHDHGLGLGRKFFHTSPAMQELGRIAPDKTVFSNNGDVVYFYTGQIGYPLGATFETSVKPPEIIVAIFTYNSAVPNSFAQRYADRLHLVIQDKVLSVYELSGNP